MKTQNLEEVGPAQEEKAQPKEVVVNIELAQALLNYLGQQPYQQVAGLIEGIQTSKFNY